MKALKSLWSLIIFWNKCISNDNNLIAFNRLRNFLPTAISMLVGHLFDEVSWWCLAIIHPSDFGKLVQYKGCWVGHVSAIFFCSVVPWECVVVVVPSFTSSQYSQSHVLHGSYAPLEQNKKHKRNIELDNIIKQQSAYAKEINNYWSYGFVPQKWAKLLIENVKLVKITNRNTPLMPIASIQLSFQK